MRPITPAWVAGWVIIALLLFGKFDLPDWKIPWPDFITPSNATAAIYVYEKDEGGVPSFMGAAINELNRRTPPILAVNFEEDTTDSTGETPDQYKAAVAAAREAGLPALVVQAGDKVLKVAKPKSFEEALEAVP